MWSIIIIIILIITAQTEQLSTLLCYLLDVGQRERNEIMVV